MSREINKRSKVTASPTSNPFRRMPKNIHQAAAQLDEEKKMERKRQRTLKVHEKGVKPRESVRKIVSRYNKEMEQEEWKEDVKKSVKANKVDLKALLSEQDGREYDDPDIKTIKDFVRTEREIRRLECCAIVGREKLQSLKEQMSVNDKEIAVAEYRVSDQAFERYTQEQIHGKKLAFKMAAEGDKARQKIDEEIQRKSDEILKVKRDIAKYEEKLKHNEMCKEFLWKLSPPEWQKQQEARKQTAEKIQEKEKKEKKPATKANTGQRNGSVVRPANSITKKPCKQEKTPKEDQVGNQEHHEKPQIYFTERKQLLKIITEMDKETNRLFEELDAAEVSLEFFRRSVLDEDQEMEKETDQVSEEIDYLNKTIKQKKAQATELKRKVTLVNESDDSPLQKKMILKQLHQKLQDVHTACIGYPHDNPTSIQMLGEIELYMYDLLDKIKSVPKGDLQPIMKEYRKEKVARIKKEEMEQVERAKEEMRQRRLEIKRQRAMAEVKKPTGKRVTWRSWLKKDKVPRDNQTKSGFNSEKELEHYLLN